METRDSVETLESIAQKLYKSVGFTGGPPALFGAVGRETIVTLLECGLLPTHNLLDFGCGALRLGWWLMRFMDTGRYYGIEPNSRWLEAGKEIVIGRDLLDLKKPHFSNNSDHRMDVFGVKFDAVVARSILTHLTPAAMAILFEQFASNSNPDAFFLASYWQHRTHNGKDIVVGEKLFKEKPRQGGGLNVTYKFKTIEAIAREAGLSIEKLDRETINIQPWIVLQKDQ